MDNIPYQGKWNFTEAIFHHEKILHFVVSWATFNMRNILFILVIFFLSEREKRGR